MILKARLSVGAGRYAPGNSSLVPLACTTILMKRLEEYP